MIYHLYINLGQFFVEFYTLPNVCFFSEMFEYMVRIGEKC